MLQEQLHLRLHQRHTCNTCSACCTCYSRRIDCQVVCCCPAAGIYRCSPNCEGATVAAAGTTENVEGNKRKMDTRATGIGK